jgi:hypothetical protein
MESMGLHGTGNLRPWGQHQRGVPAAFRAAQGNRHSVSTRFLPCLVSGGKDAVPVAFSIASIDLVIVTVAGILLVGFACALIALLVR